MTTTSHWQPELWGQLTYARPLRESDYDQMLKLGSDPQIWSMHPEPDRYLPEKFARFFHSGLASGGGLAIFDRTSGEMIGSSRYMSHRPESSLVEIGYTFYARDFWGKGHNSEIKRLMINHAFMLVERIQFFVGEKNLRSRRAMTKLGAKIVAQTRRLQSGGDWAESVVFEIKKSDWLDAVKASPSTTTRLITN